MANDTTRPLIPAECLWTWRDVAAFLRIGRNSVYRMAQSGTLPSVLVGARYRFVPEEIRTWVARRRDQGAALLPLNRERR